MTELNVKMDALRELLYQPPAEFVWTRLCALLDRWDPSTVHLGVGYAEGHLTSWPDLLREPPAAWRQAALQGHPPRGWPLVRLVDLVLEEPDSAMIHTIQALQKHLGVWGGKAMSLCQQVPAVLVEGIGGATAQRLGRSLEEAGAIIRLRPSEVPWGAPASGEGILHAIPTELFVITVEHVESVYGEASLISYTLKLEAEEARELRGLLSELPTKLPKAMAWLEAQRLIRKLEKSGAVARMDPAPPS